MGLWFQNGYTDPVYIAMLWYDAGCSGEPWRKSGWYQVASGSSAEIVGANLQSIPDSNFAWFAQADWADGPCWSGDPAHNWYAIPHNAAFDQCYSDNTGCNAAYPFNAATLSRSSSDWTIVLLQPGAAGQGFQGCSFGFAGQPTAHLLDFTVPAQLVELVLGGGLDRRRPLLQQRQHSHSVPGGQRTAWADRLLSQPQLLELQCHRLPRQGADLCRSPQVRTRLGRDLCRHICGRERRDAALHPHRVVRRRRPFYWRLWHRAYQHALVTDPIFGQSLVSYATLTGGTYQGNGTWTNTYFTS